MSNKVNLDGHFTGELLLRYEETKETPGRHSTADAPPRLKLITIAVGKQGIETSDGDAVVNYNSVNPTVARLTREFDSQGPWMLRLNTHAISNTRYNMAIFINSLITALGQNKTLNKKSHTLLSFEININNFDSINDDVDDDVDNNVDNTEDFRKCRDAFSALWAQESDSSRTCEALGGKSSNDPRRVIITLR